MAPKDESSSQFPKLSEMIGGRKVDKTLGFIDITGTKAWVAEYLKNPSFSSQVALSQLQAAFSSALAKLAESNPSLEIIVASDGAFLVGSSSDVLNGLVELFASVPSWRCSFKIDGLQPLPMRAAMAKGLVQIQVSESVSALDNFSQIPYWGEAFTKVYKMERSQPKGLRLFITKSVADDLQDTHAEFIVENEVAQVDIYGEGAESYFQVNWLIMPPIGGTNIMTKFIEIGRQWANSEDEHYRLHGQSIVELSGA